MATTGSLTANIRQMNPGQLPIYLNFSDLQSKACKAKADPHYSRQLFDLVSRSKTDKTISMAAAEALSILVAAGQSFAGIDLSGISVKGAIIDGGNFDKAKLDDADLTNVSAKGTWFGGASLARTNMQNIDFGEVPYFETDGNIVAIAVDSVRSRIIVGDNKGYIYVWNPQTAKLIHNKFRGHAGSINQILLSPDQTKFISGGSDNRVKVWNANDYSVVKIMDTPWEGINGMALDPFNPWVALSGYNNGAATNSQEIIVRNYNDGKQVFRFATPYKHLYTLAFSPQGLLASYGVQQEGILCVWDIQTGGCLAQETMAHFQNHQLSFSQSGEMIAVAPQTDRIFLFKVLVVVRAILGEQGSTNAERSLILQQHGELRQSFKINALHFLKNDTQLLALSSTCESRIWDLETLEVIRTSFLAYFPLAAQPLTGTPSMVVGSYKKAFVWKVAQDNLPSKPHNFSISIICSLPDKNRFFTGDTSGVMHLWDATTKECLYSDNNHTNSISCFTNSSNGRLLITGSKDASICVHDLSAKQCTHIFKITDSRGEHRETPEILGLAITPDNRHIIAACYDQTVRVWNLEEQRPVSVINDPFYTMMPPPYSSTRDHKASPHFIVPLEDSSKFLVFCDDETLMLFRIGDKKPLSQRKVTHLQPGNPYLDEFVRKQEVLRLQKPPKSIAKIYEGFRKATYLDEGRQIATYSNGHHISVWDSRKGKLLKEIHFSEKIYPCYFTFLGPEKIVTVEGQNAFAMYNLEEDTPKMIWRSGKSLEATKALIQDADISEEACLVLKQHGAITELPQEEQAIATQDQSERSPLLLKEDRDNGCCSVM